MTNYLARVYYNPDGSTTAFAVPFPYLDQSHVHIYESGNEITSGFTWTNSTTITFTTAPTGAAGSLSIMRITPSNAMLHTIQIGTILPADINVDDLQLLYLCQECADQVAGTVGVQAALAEIQNDIAVIDALLGSLSGDYIFSRAADAYLNVPTGSEPNGYRALVGSAPSGAFAGYMGLIAEKISGVWIFSPTPKQGQHIYNAAKLQDFIYRNTWWNPVDSNVVGAVYQDFTYVPAGTAANGLILASGQSLGVQGPGNTSHINAGTYGNAYVPDDNSYLVVAFPQRNLYTFIEGSYRRGTGGSLVLAAGRLVSGAIIGQMVHDENLYQTIPGISIWGGPRQTTNPSPPPPTLGYLADAQLQYSLRVLDTNYAIHAAPAKTRHSMVIQDNRAVCYGDDYHWQNSYTDDMISNSLGDDESGNLGYLYFQTGGILSANLPDIYRILAYPLAPQDILPDPKYLPDLSLLPINRSANAVFTNTGTSTTIVLMTVTPGSGSSMAFDILAICGAVVALTGYAQQLSKWLWNVRNYNGAVAYDQPTLIGAKIPISLASGTAAYSLALSADDDGAGNVRLKAVVTRTGTDTTAGNSLVSAKILGAGQVGAIS